VYLVVYPGVYLDVYLGLDLGVGLCVYCITIRITVRVVIRSSPSSNAHLYIIKSLELLTSSSFDTDSNSAVSRSLKVSRGSYGTAVI
jgi:hypothetical protein